MSEPDPFELLEVPGRQALNTLKHHRDRYAETGLFPFLIGPAEELERLRESTEGMVDANPIDATIRAALTMNLPDWIHNRRQQAVQDGGWDETKVFGEWLGEAPDKGSIGAHRNILTGEIYPVVYLGLAKVEAPWQLPAVVRYGGWNDCPSPPEHCLFFRHWEATYGTQIVSMTGDVIEATVERPPTTPEGAIELAWQQFWYCPDVVHQGVGTVAKLAGTLLNSDCWYFWWD